MSSPLVPRLFDSFRNEAALGKSGQVFFVAASGKNYPDVALVSHMAFPGLFEIVKTINAKMLFPIHTEHPTEYVRATNKMTVVEEGKKYVL